MVSKGPVYVVFTTIVVAVCLVFYLGADSDEGESSWFLPILGTTTQTLEQAELANVLKKASMESKTVIITTLNQAWATPNSIIDMFLESFSSGEQTQPLLKHLIIVAVDEPAFNRCRTIHPHCFLLNVKGVDFTGEKKFMSPDYLTLIWKRIVFLQNVLELGYSFVFTDADIMWLRSPFQHFSSSDDLTIACDYFRGNSYDLGNLANGGFTYVKSCAKTIQFYKYWYKSRELYPNNHDQAVFDIIKESDPVKHLGLKIRFLDTAFFGGFCQPSKDLNKVCTMHANCCVGLEKKIHDLRLVLEDWGNFTILPPEKKSGDFSWRIPDRCKMW